MRIFTNKITILTCKLAVFSNNKGYGSGFTFLPLRRSGFWNYHKNLLIFGCALLSKAHPSYKTKIYLDPVQYPLQEVQDEHPVHEREH